MSNTAYVSYSIADTTQMLNPYWQRLYHRGSSASVISDDTLTVTLPGTVTVYGETYTEFGGVIRVTPLTLENTSLAVKLQPGNAASSSYTAWAGIQLSTTVPLQVLSQGDPTHPSCYPLLRFVVQQGNLWYGVVTSSGTTEFSGEYTTSPVYDPVNHKYIRLNGTNALTSPDGITWSVFAAGAEGMWDVTQFCYPELLTYSHSTAEVVSTAVFSNYIEGTNVDGVGNLSLPVGVHIPIAVTGNVPATPAVTVSAVILSSANTVISTTGNGLPKIAVPFNYGDQPHDIQESVVSALRMAASDSSLRIVFI